jgi:hypothetical protein
MMKTPIMKQLIEWPSAYLTTLLLCCLALFPGSIALAENAAVACPENPATGRVNEVIEFCFSGSKNWDAETPACGEGPYDYEVNRVTAAISDHNGVDYGFTRAYWDGGNTWRVRFLPPRPAVYYLRIYSNDSGLDNLVHVFDATAQTNPIHALRRDGPFLKTSDGKVVRTNGAPLFLLGDKWATFPSFFYPNDPSLGVATRFPRKLTHSDSLPHFTPDGKTHSDFDEELVWGIPFDQLLQKRSQQGFNFIGAHGLHRRVVFEKLVSGEKTYPTITGLAAFSPKAEFGLRYWRLLDHYFQKAEQAGMVMTLGIQSYSYFDNPSLCKTTAPMSAASIQKVHRNYFRHLLARYGAYPMTFWLTQEFNQLVTSTTVINGRVNGGCDATLYEPAPSSGLYCFVDPGVGGEPDRNVCLKVPSDFANRCWFKPAVFTGRLRLLWNIASTIKAEDPHKRAIMIHEGSRRQTSLEIVQNGRVVGLYAPARAPHTPVDIVATQQGHRMMPRRYYSGARSSKPLYETEFNWEGGETRRNNLPFVMGDSKRRPSSLTEDSLCRYNNDSCVVVDSYTSISSFLQALFAGSPGYGYGAFGLYNGILDSHHPETTGDWGPLVNAAQGLNFPGAKLIADFKKGVMGETPSFGNTTTRLYHSAQAWPLLRTGHAAVDELVPGTQTFRRVSGGKVRVLSTKLDASDNRFVALYFEKGDAGSYRVQVGQRLNRGAYRIVGISPRSFERFHSPNSESVACPDSQGFIELPRLPVRAPSANDPNEIPDERDWLMFVENALPSTPVCP